MAEMCVGREKAQGLLFVVVCIVVIGIRTESSGFRVPKVAEGNPMMHAEYVIVINNPMHINPVFAAIYIVGQWLRKGSRLAGAVLASR